MKNKLAIVGIICMLLISICGCAGNSENSYVSEYSSQTDNTEIVRAEDTMVTLTERQKQILEENGLPGDYNQLTDSQKDAIVKIEDVLEYLEKKYNNEFEYDGYVSGGLDGQYVTAKIANTIPEKYVTVYIAYENNEYKYSDNYEELVAEDEYVEQVQAFLDDFFDVSEFQVYIDITELKEDGTSIVERAVGCPVILIDDVYSDSEVESAAQAYGEWIANMNANGGGADFRVFSSDLYQTINAVNYKNFFGKDKLWLSLSVNSDKTIDLQRY